MINNTKDIHIGDLIQLWNDCTGTVVFSVDNHEFSNHFPEKDWNYLTKGFMVQTEDGILFFCDKLDEDMKII